MEGRTSCHDAARMTSPERREASPEPSEAAIDAAFKASWHASTAMSADDMRASLRAAYAVDFPERRPPEPDESTNWKAVVDGFAQQARDEVTKEWPSYWGPNAYAAYRAAFNRIFAGAIRTEREMHNAWRKRAEEAEAALPRTAVPQEGDVTSALDQAVAMLREVGAFLEGLKRPVYGASLPALRAAPSWRAIRTLQRIAECAKWAGAAGHGDYRDIESDAVDTLALLGVRGEENTETKPT